MRHSNFTRSRKFRYGSLSMALTALVIALVVMLNAGISALSNKYGFYVDMTSEQLYTLTDACSDLLEENFDTIAEERSEFNKNLPATNYTIAQTNQARIADSITAADKNISTAEKNIALAARNLETLAKSIVIAEDNLGIAERNLILAEGLLEYITSKEGEDAESTKAAAALLADAEENLRIAESNITTVNANRAAASGFNAPQTFLTLDTVDGYKYYGAFTSHINNDDGEVAGRNKQIAEENKSIAAENAQIAAANLLVAQKNMNAGAVPGTAGYTAPAEYLPYVAFENFTTYQKINGAETPRSYESYLETESDSILKGEVKVKIILCDDRDAWDADTAQRYVLETIEDMARAFPNIISVEFVNVWTNPSAVQKYKNTSLTNIYSTNVIVESGSEWRVFSLNSLYTFNDASSSDPNGYNGEKKLSVAILAVLKAESPIACVTINHGEIFADYELLYLLEDAGYIVRSLNLATEEIPEDCRLMVIYNPTSDFLIRDNISDVSEIAKINTWLDEFNSLAVFMSPDSPVLPNLEEYLEEWGVSFSRSYNKDANQFLPYMIKDSGQSLTADGMTIVAEYTTKGLGASIHTDMRSVPYPAKVIFKNSMSISYSPSYSNETYEDEEDSSNNYKYGYYYSNGVSRSIYDVFVSSPNAVAMAGGEQVASANSLDPFKLMTITRETQMVSNEDPDYSYVLACASTAFASQDMLQSVVYGNSEVLIAALRVIGRETVVVSLDAKRFSSTKIETITTAQANQYTIILTVIPAAIVFGIGIYVVIRRKYS